MKSTTTTTASSGGGAAGAAAAAGGSSDGAPADVGQGRGPATAEGGDDGGR
jgi:hypothetical protein